METFALILTNLRSALAARAGRDQALAALVLVVWVRLSRMALRFERLVANWWAGILPRVRASRAGQDYVVSDTPRLPVGAGWLLGYVPEVAVYGSQLEHFLSSEECQRFLAEVPQAGRLVRPLLRMLGVGVDMARPRKVRPVWGAPVSGATIAPAALVMGWDGRLRWV